MRTLVAVGLSALLLSSCATVEAENASVDDVVAIAEAAAAEVAAEAATTNVACSETAPCAEASIGWGTALAVDTARPQTDRARDAARKPAEMLDFAGVKPGTVVVDFWPGGGYFTRVLSWAVGPEGRVYAIAPQEIQQRFGQKAIDGVNALNADAATPNVKASFQPAAQIAAPEPVDLVFTAQNYHDLHEDFMGPADVAAFNKAIYATLKPGGVFLVIDHVAAPGSGLGALNLHRIDPEVVKREVVAAGFVFEGETEVLRNPQDPHAANVFDASIRGHTDQFVYKFRKPRR